MCYQKVFVGAHFKNQNLCLCSFLNKMSTLVHILSKKYYFVEITIGAVFVREKNISFKMCLRGGGTSEGEVQGVRARGN